jgi:hypothetical protein
MFEWLLALAPVTYAEPPKKDYIGMVAAEVAYAALLPDSPVTKPLVDTKDCTRCKGSGKIPTGDSNHPWTDCPDCEPKTGDKVKLQSNGPNPAMRLQVKPLPPVKTSDCDGDSCPIPSKQGA